MNINQYLKYRVVYYSHIISILPLSLVAIKWFEPALLGVIPVFLWRYVTLSLFRCNKCSALVNSEESSFFGMFNIIDIKPRLPEKCKKCGETTRN